jgi:predicted secreted protein
VLLAFALSSCSQHPQQTWRSVLAAVIEAKAEADSRQKQLVVYFATDYEDFRPVVTRLLANVTTPVFGLRTEDVGHIVYGR